MAKEEAGQFEAVVAGLPNGLHDAALYEVWVDLAAQTCSLVVGADTSSAASGESLPRLRRGRLSLSGITMLEIEPLRVPRSVQTGDYISIDAGLVEEERPKGLPRVEVPPGSWAVWVFLREPNSFIQVVANAARFEWLE